MNDERGFLLTELTVTITLLVVILAIAFIFFFFCQRSFSEGEKKTIVQSNVRLAANYITKEVRYANIISTIETDMPEGVLYYCLKLDGKSLKKETTEEDGTKSDRIITQDACLDALNFKFRTEKGKHFLLFEIKGDDEALKKEHVISSEILLVNIKALKDVTLEGSEIYFTKPNLP